MYLLVKASFDRIAALIVLLLLCPLFFFVALLVRFSLGSPIIFRQQRSGYLGRPFFLLKFRTMTNVRGPDGFLLPDGHRLTPLGCWLRKTSLDELPSLINILNGKMSFVGPRPFVMKLDDLDPCFHSRYNVLPGLTGWAQVNGRNSISWQKKFDLDCWYVTKISFLLDLFILFRTIFVLFDHHSVNADGFATSPSYTP